jgi:hypothetical protein
LAAAIPNRDVRPSAAGWYPDPWSATGSGERYFDGKQWGSTERPLARHATQPVDLRSRARRPRRGRVLLVVLVVAAIGGAAWAFVKRASPAPSANRRIISSHRSQTSRRRSGATTTTIFGLMGVNYKRGDCVIWPQTPAERQQTHQVSCSEPHVIEISGRVDVTGRFDHYPTFAELNKRVFDIECAAQVESLMGHVLDPNGRFSAGGIYPSEQGWRAGDRTVWCGATGVSLKQLKYPWELLAFRGRVEGANQTLLLPIGTCWSSASPYEKSCSAPHEFEVTGYVDLTGRTTQPPADNDSAAWVALVGDGCRNAARNYLGHDPFGNISSSYESISPASWSGGRRVVECTVARYENGKIVPTTSLRQ